MRLKSIAALAMSRRRLVLVAALLFLIVSGAVGADAIEKLSSGGFNDPGSESVHADRQLRDTFGIAVPTLVLLVSADAPIDSPEVAAAGRELVDKLAHTQGVEQVESFWTSDQLGAALQSKDGLKALIRAQLAGDDNELAKRGRALAAQFGGTHGPLHVEATGYAVLLAETEDIAKQDLVKSEVIAIPLTFIALFLIFRGLAIAMDAPTLFSRLLAGSVTMIFFTYAFVNMGMVSGILPVVGVPLPFLSYGGTALLTLFIGAGILMSVHRHRRLVQT